MTHLDPTVINHWWRILGEIDTMLREVTEQHITITGYSMDLTGPTASAEPPLPGGERLDITGPWSSNATYGDQATPRQVVIEWDQTIRQHRAGADEPPPARSFAVALRYLRDETARILESPYAAAWCQDIEGVHGRLRSLCPPEVDQRHDSTPIEVTVTEDMLWKALEGRPDHELTRRDLTHLGINASTLTTWRHRGKITETRPGCYRAGDIIEARRTA